jgi:hypothetical protein
VIEVVTMLAQSRQAPAVDSHSAFGAHKPETSQDLNSRPWKGNSMAILRLTGKVKVRVIADGVRLLFETKDGDDVELNLSSRDASRFALDLSQAAAAALQTEDLTRSEREQGYETVVALKVALANYGMDKHFENIFLSLREENGAEFCFSLDKEECIEFARTVLLRTSGQSLESAAKH